MVALGAFGALIGAAPAAAEVGPAGTEARTASGLQGAALDPSFTAPTNVDAGEVVGFDGVESTASGPAEAPLPRPVATAIVGTRSLTETLDGGLPVRYSVNQQVAGHFEVLLPTRLAKRLHIAGPAAEGLVPGAAPQTVIAYALLVTLRKAQDTLRITIPPPTAARLSHMHEVTITLRLVVRNAARSKPKLTVLQTVVKLRR